MLKAGLIFIGKPSIHLHEMISLALCLKAPLAVSDPTCFEICQKFSSILALIRLDQYTTPNQFMAGIEVLYTNLQPYELLPFFTAYPHYESLKVYHLIENGITIRPCKEGTVFCSSFSHNQKLVPTSAKWQNLGPVGYLSFKKYKKELLGILESTITHDKLARLSVAQFLNDSSSFKILSEHTLDQIEFINMAFSGFDEDKSHQVIPAHGLVDIACDQANAIVIWSPELSTLALNHKKPVIINSSLGQDYSELSPLTCQMPNLYQNLVPLIDNYFKFETINREEFIKKCYSRFF